LGKQTMGGSSRDYLWFVINVVTLTELGPANLTADAETSEGTATASTLRQHRWRSCGAAEPTVSATHVRVLITADTKVSGTIPDGPGDRAGGPSSALQKRERISEVEGTSGAVAGDVGFATPSPSTALQGAPHSGGAGPAS
jgi:hypothetical protein